jgi:hypothetical protein
MSTLAQQEASEFRASGAARPRITVDGIYGPQTKKALQQPRVGGRRRIAERIRRQETPG